jgi:hypothetical protein
MMGPSSLLCLLLLFIAGVAKSQEIPLEQPNDPNVKAFYQTLDALKPWFDEVRTELKNIEASSQLQAVKEQRLKQLATKMPFPASGYYLAWPFWLQEVKSINGDLVSIELRPAILPPILDKSLIAIFQVYVEAGGTGIVKGVNAFNAPRTRLVNDT